VSATRPRAVRSALGRVLAPLSPGDWVPGRHNAALLTVQLVALYQAALRGRDYLEPRTGDQIRLQNLGVVEAAGSLHVWGLLFYATAAIALVGLAGRWAVVVIAAHALIFAWYVGVGFGLLQAQGINVTPSVVAGMLCAGAGTWLVFRRRPPSAVVRLIVGVPAMLVGQELMASGLGQDYRTGTGLMAAGVMHLSIAVGTWLLWQRQRLVRQVEQEQGVVLPR